MTWLLLATVALGSYRLARLVAVDTLFLRFRERMLSWAYVLNDDEAEPRGSARTYLYELVTCAHCLGVWFAAALTVVVWCWVASMSWAEALVFFVAAAGLQSIATSVVGRLEPATDEE